MTGGPSPPVRPAPAADPDVDGVALAVATATGVALGARVPAVAGWVVAACCLAAACLWPARASLRQPGA
ncbi:MAG TPA: hypothetical protein VHM23_13085, partial [Actinomycetota bacterium]|nr:hypothetical protein [Actinomycetota bacterium]